MNCSTQLNSSMQFSIYNNKCIYLSINCNINKPVIFKVSTECCDGSVQFVDHVNDNRMSNGGHHPPIVRVVRGKHSSLWKRKIFACIKVKCIKIGKKN